MSTKLKSSQIAIRFLVVVAVALICSFMVTKLLFSFAFIYGDSMKPSYNDRDVVFLDRTAHTKTTLKANDVIVFTNKNVYAHPIVKRVVATSGQTVEIKNGILLIDGQENENFVFTFDENENMPAITVEEGCYFVIGDNTTHSEDSRNIDFGTVAKKDIIGKVIFTVIHSK